MGLSNAHRNVISAVSMANGAALQLQEDYLKRGKNKTVLLLSKRVIRASRAAFATYPPIPVEEVRPLAIRMKRLETQAFSGTILEEPRVYLAFIAGMLSDILEMVKDPSRHQALDALHSTVWQLLLYFDRRLKRMEDYDKAIKAINVWYRLAA